MIQNARAPRCVAYSAGDKSIRGSSKKLIGRRCELLTAFEPREAQERQWASRGSTAPLLSLRCGDREEKDENSEIRQKSRQVSLL